LVSGAKLRGFRLWIPGDGDQRSEVMPITIPK
jgi:hypothetical protein